jgi:hypothetical protein
MPPIMIIKIHISTENMLKAISNHSIRKTQMMNPIKIPNGKLMKLEFSNVTNL